MRKTFLIIILSFVFANTKAQSFNVDELMKVADLPSKNINDYMKKKGFVFLENNSDSTGIKASFTEKNKCSKKNVSFQRTVDLDIKENLKCFTLYMADVNEYQQGLQKLIKAGFFYDTTKNLITDSLIFFQKANLNITAGHTIKDSIASFHFNLQEKSIPSSLRFAEDLLQFDCHRFLASYFGEQNVKKDMYYLTEKELKPCSVLFSGTQRQAVFIWDDEVYLNKLLYIIFSNRLPTEGGLKNDPLYGNNEWQLKNGIRPGMALKDLLKINEFDFNFYGNKSELAFLIKPGDEGKIDFKKTAVMLSCPQCYDNKIFNQKEVSALEAAKADLPMRVFDVVVYR